MEVARSPATSAVFHRINVTGERRLRFNYYANLRFNRACAPDAPNGTVAAASPRAKWIGKMASEMTAMKLARLASAVGFYGHPPARQTVVHASPFLNRVPPTDRPTERSRSLFPPAPLIFICFLFPRYLRFRLNALCLPSCKRSIAYHNPFYIVPRYSPLIRSPLVSHRNFQTKRWRDDREPVETRR